MKRTGLPRSLLIIGCWCLPLLGVLLSDSPLLAACVEEPAAGAVEHTFVRHLSGCSEREREARAVIAEELLAALKSGKGIDLAGVVVRGDLGLDELTPVPVEAVAGLSPEERNAVSALNEQQIRLVPGPLVIRDSVVKGSISTRITEGFVVIRGPVTLTGTVFEHALDLSRGLFLGPVDLSHAVLLREGFFIHGRFTRPARFVETAFGVHARFFRSVFAEPATFSQARFNGLAELLEVTFEKDADFSRTSFTMGTGFSGSEFRGLSNFSEAVFEREAYFLFSVFEKEASFRKAAFRSVADFSDSQFKGVDDFTKATFAVQPQFARAKLVGGRSTPFRSQDSSIQLAVTAAFLLFAAVLVVYLMRTR